MELAILNTSGKETGRKVDLNDSIFGIEPNDHAIYLDVKQHMANQRQGTHATLEKSTVSGSTKKLHKQKGTGGSRKGSIKSPLFRGGARIFGPQPRDYNFKLNKKLKKLARISALSYKVKESNLVVLEDFIFDSPKTKNVSELLKSFQLTGKKTLVVVNSPDSNLLLAARNLKRVKIVRTADLNTYEILDAKQVLMTESSIPEIVKIHQN